MSRWASRIVPRYIDEVPSLAAKPGVFYKEIHLASQASLTESGKNYASRASKLLKTKNIPWSAERASESTNDAAGAFYFASDGSGIDTCNHEDRDHNTYVGRLK